MKNLIIIALLAFLATEGLSQSALPTPSLLQVSKCQQDTCVILKWEAAPDQILGFVIEKKEGTGQWLIVAQAEPAEKYFVDRNCHSQVAYYRIRSFANRLLSDYSNVKDYNSLATR